MSKFTSKDKELFKASLKRKLAMTKIKPEDLLEALSNAKDVEASSDEAPLSPEAAMAFAKEAVSKGNIEFASEDNISFYNKEVGEILEAIGYPDAWVSDLSAISDFGHPEDEIVEMSEKLGVPVDRHDLIVDLAKLLRNKKFEIQ